MLKLIFVAALVPAAFLEQSRTHIIVGLVLLATIIFILHQMLNNEADSSMRKANALNLEGAEFLLPKVDQGNGNHYLKLLHGQSLLKANTKFLGKRLVHLDLKGAPPRVSYFNEFFPFIKKLGATGVLLEYEDMFPYYEELENIPAYNSYNLSEISSIVNYAKIHGLDIIPLVQTFGHLEFVLKLKDYRKLREVDAFPQVLCPTHPETLPLIFKMIDQVVKSHPEISYIHIGSDEVYHIGRCERCSRLMAARRWTTDELFLSHVFNVTTYINEKYPNIKPIMWDDELRKLSPVLIEEFKIPKLTDIMIWKYTPNVAEYITDDMLDMYSRLFQKVWIASAFKGATGPDSMITNIQHHLENHASWMNIVAHWNKSINFLGVAITGWQRYDHFAVLCELLPVAIPSLAACLQYLEGKDVDERAIDILFKCNSPIAWSPLHVTGSQSGDGCDFPGAALYRQVAAFYGTLRELSILDKDVAHGWFQWYNVINRFSNPSNVEAATSQVDYLKLQLQYLEERLGAELRNVYDEHTADEWLATYLLPPVTRLTAITEARDKLLQQEDWPRRPLDRVVSVKRELEKVCDGTQSVACTLLGTFP